MREYHGAACAYGELALTPTFYCYPGTPVLASHDLWRFWHSVCAGCSCCQCRMSLFLSLLHDGVAPVLQAKDGTLARLVDEVHGLRARQASTAAVVAHQQAAQSPRLAATRQRAPVSLSQSAQAARSMPRVAAPVAMQRLGRSPSAREHRVANNLKVGVRRQSQRTGEVPQADAAPRAARTSAYRGSSGSPTRQLGHGGLDSSLDGGLDGDSSGDLTTMKKALNSSLHAMEASVIRRVSSSRSSVILATPIDTSRGRRGSPSPASGARGVHTPNTGLLAHPSPPVAPQLPRFADDAGGVDGNSSTGSPGSDESLFAVAVTDDGDPDNAAVDVPVATVGV